MQEKEQEFSFKNLFVPLTTTKAIHWIIFIGLIVYFNALFNGFVWDDKTYILYNQEIHKFDLLSNFRENLFNSNGQYRPIISGYFSVLYLLFKNFSFPYHLLPILIHITNSALLFIFLKNIFNRTIAFFLTLYFLVHPMQIESVSYISAVASPLSFLFGIKALLISTKDRLSSLRLISIASLVLLSLLAKETGFLFAFIILIYRFILKNKNIISIFFSIFISAFVYLFIRFVIGGVYFSNPQYTPIQKLTFTERLINIPEIFLYYLKTFFYPVHLLVNQQWIVTSINFKNFYLPLLFELLFLVGILFWGIYLYKKNRFQFKILIFFSIWYFVGISLYLQIFPINITVADRWFYFPIVGLLGIAGTVFNSLKITKRNAKIILYSLSILVALVLSLKTVERNSNWRDAITLYTHDSKYYTNSNIENSLGNEFLLQKNYKDATIHLERSIQMDPNEINISNLANAYMFAGNTEKAKEYYYKTFSAKQNSRTKHEKIIQNAYEQLATLSVKTEEPTQSLQFIKSALEKYPDSGILWVDLALVENTLHNQQEALVAAKKAVNLSPTNLNKYIYNQILNGKEINLQNGK